MNFHASYGHAAKFQLSHKSESDFSDLYLKLMELKKATPLDILKITAEPAAHSIDVLVEPAKVLNYKAFFTSLGCQQSMSVHDIYLQPQSDYKDPFLRL